MYCRIDVHIQTGIKFKQYLQTLPQKQQPDFVSHGDCDLEIGKFIISQTCPLTMQPIRYPCKGQACSHMEVRGKIFKVISFP